MSDKPEKMPRSRVAIYIIVTILAIIAFWFIVYYKDAFDIFSKFQGI